MIITDGVDTLVPVTLHDALSQAWTAIRKEVVAPKLPDVPDATIGVGRGPLHVTEWDHAVVMVPPATVTGGGAKILEFLLHQAAHSLVTEPSAAAEGRRYHNEEYARAARRVGLAVEYASTAMGWSDTSLTPALAEIYADPIVHLDVAASSWRPVTHDSRNGVVAQCQCHPARKIRVRGTRAAEDLAEHPVVCSVCGKPFVAL